MKYFSECKTIEDVKSTYRKLAMKLHPDCGGSAQAFTEMSAEYKVAFERFKNVFRNKDGETYEKENTENPEMFKDIIDKIIHFEDVKIEIIGTWIWVSGNTRPYADELKSLNFHWCRNKVAWSFHTEPFKRRRGKTVGRTACLLLLRIWSETLKATKSILYENINSKNNNQG